MSMTWVLNAAQVVAAGLIAPYLVKVVDNFLQQDLGAWVPYIIAICVGLIFVLMEQTQSAAIGFIFGVVTFAVLTHQAPQLIPWIWPQDVRAFRF